MTAGLPMLSPDIVHEVGWTIIHFVWQAFGFAALMEFALRNCRVAVARHNWALGALALMIVAFVATFLRVHGQVTVLPLVAPTTSATMGMALSSFIAPSWMDWIVLGWLAGISVLAVRVIAGWFMAAEVCRRLTSPVSGDVLACCQRIQRRVAVSRRVRFLQSSRIDAPVVVGRFRPVVLIPDSAVLRLPMQQLEAVIAHELAHIRRLDGFVNVILVVAETLLFFHPAVWRVTRRIRAERELCCDDIAVSTCADAAGYAEALLTLSVSKHQQAFAVGSTSGNLKRRIAHLLGEPAEQAAVSIPAILAVALLCAIGATFAVAQIDPRFSISIIDDAINPRAGAVPRGDDLVATREPGKGVPPALLLKREGTIAGNVVAEAHVTNGPDGKPVVQFTLTPQAQNEFATLSRQNIGRRAAIVVDGKVVASPVIRAPMLSGKAQISGNFNQAEADALASAITGTKP